MPNSGEIKIKTLANSFTNPGFSMIPSTATRPPYDDEYLGPVEAPIPSNSYSHNMSAFGLVIKFFLF